MTASLKALNALQVAVVKEFAKRFLSAARVLHVRSAPARKSDREEQTLAEFGIEVEEAHRLPHVILFDDVKDSLYLFQIAGQDDPMTPQRVAELCKIASNSTVNLTFVSVFSDFDSWREFADRIEWGTHVWIADSPSHMIHFNGGRFLGPYTKSN